MGFQIKYALDNLALNLNRPDKPIQQDAKIMIFNHNFFREQISLTSPPLPGFLLKLGRLYPVDESPRLIRDKLDKIESLIIPERDNGLSFRLPKEMVLPAEKADELVLVPFFRIHETRYMLYWPVTAD